jgi:hypothetical protein
VRARNAGKQEEGTHRNEYKRKRKVKENTPRTLIIVHLNEAEALGATAAVIHDNLHGGQRAKRGEKIAKIVVLRNNAL